MAALIVCLCTLPLGYAICWHEAKPVERAKQSVDIAEREGGIAVTEAKEKHIKDLHKLFDAYQECGLTLEAQENYEEAVANYREALEYISKKNAPEQWAELQHLLGNAADDWADRSEGNAVRQHRDEVIAAFRAALEVRTRETLPRDWAATQNNLAVALRNQASAVEGAERAALLAEAVETYRAALEVYTRETLPQDWAMTQNNLAIVLCHQASVVEGSECAALLAEAVEAYRAALTVRTRETLPQGWAMTQNNLANALRHQAMKTVGKTEKERLLKAAITAFENALEVYTKEHFPGDYQNVQNGIKIVRKLLAELEE